MPRGTQAKDKNDKGKPSTSQKRQKSSLSTSQARRRRDRDSGDDSEEEAEESNASDDGSSSIKAKAYDLVRMALFAENSRTSLKKDDINKKIMGPRTRTFNMVFGEAQRILQKTFGLELAELMTRVERDQATSLDDTKGKKKETASSKTYILRSTLPKALIEVSIEPSPIIRAALAEQAESIEEDDRLALPDDTLIAWRAMDDPSTIGILHVVLALIMVNGRSLPDPQLRAQLKQLRLRPGISIPNSVRSTQKVNSVETLLTSFAKSGYLDRQRNALAGSAPAPTQGRGRKRANDDDNGHMDEFEWKWGSRAFAEIGETGIAEFIRDFMGERFSQRTVDGEEGVSREEGVKSKEQEKYEEAVYKDLVRSAGGKLIELKGREGRHDAEED